MHYAELQSRTFYLTLLILLARIPGTDVRLETLIKSRDKMSDKASRGIIKNPLSLHFQTTNILSALKQFTEHIGHRLLTRPVGVQGCQTGGISRD